MAPGERALRHPMGHAPPWPVTEHPMVHAPPWPVTEHPMAGMQQNDTLPVSDVVGLSAMQHFLLGSSADLDLAADEYACDEFRMYEFKVRRCPRGRVHDWTECPYAHSGEKARRRDPRRFQYSGSPCPDFRRGGGAASATPAISPMACSRHGSTRHATGPSPAKTAPHAADACAFSLTPPSSSASSCPPSPTSSGKIGVNIFSSPTSTLALLSSPSDGSPPLSPLGVDDVLAAMRNLQLGKVRSALPFGTRSGFASPASLESDPATRGRRAAAAVADQSAPRLLEDWGRQEEAAEPAPDLAWVSELVKD